MARKKTDYLYFRDGKRILPDRIKPEHIDPYHIARGLSNIKRFNGQTDITVLRHSLAVAEHFPRWSTTYVYALLHDAAEAYMMDVPVPLKRGTNDWWVDNYEVAEEAILSYFGVAVSDEDREAVANIDKSVVPYEMTIEKMMGRGQMEYPGGYRARLVDHIELHHKYTWGMPDQELANLYMARLRIIKIKARLLQGYLEHPEPASHTVQP